jgi:hypothetical protein
MPSTKEKSTFGTSYLPDKGVPKGTLQTAAAALAPAAPQVAPVAAPAGAPAGAPAAGAPDWLHDFIMKILGPAMQAQNQNAAAQNQFRQDATFGRHLGMDGQPMANMPSTPLSFDQLSVPLADRIAKERATFGGMSFTAGDRSAPTAAAMQATQPPPQTMGHLAPWMPPGPMAATPGSPVWRQQQRMF